MLIIFSGLPGTGKTSIAKSLAKKLRAVYLRIDTIEQAILNAKLNNKEEVGCAGYAVGYAVAKDNLEYGLTVIADSVNPLKITRQAWRKVALDMNVPFIEIEVICLDQTEHRSRVESQKSDIFEFQLPTWQEVINKEYEKWDSPHLVIDTSKTSIEEATQSILWSLP